MEEYESYNIIQNHMKVSEALYEINLLGKHVLREIQLKKNTKIGGRKGYAFGKEYEIIFNSIHETINMRRFRSRLYLSLQYYLDEALFNTIPETCETFYIEDDVYDLTALYFDQSLWIRTNGPQMFELLPSTEFQVDDAVLLNCFFKKYETLLSDIEKLLSSTPDSVRYKRKINQVITRIRAKHSASIRAIMEIINDTINE